MKQESASSEPVFKRILVAVDGSQSSMSASKLAIDLAKRHGSDLIFLNVLYSPTYWMGYSQAGMPPTYVTELLEREQREAEELIRKVKGMAGEVGVEARGEVLNNISSVVQAITDYASNIHVDLIVVGTRGLSGFKKMLIGSVSSGVVTHSPCSVLVVR